MKKILILTLLILVLVGIAYAMMTRTAPPEWTTDSDPARAEFERGVKELMKYYHREATERFQAALELDPDFVAPKLMLVPYTWDPPELERLIGELREADRESLTARERFLLDYTLAKADRDTERASAVIEDYLDVAPEDPFVLMTCSADAWEERNWERASKHYRKLIKTNPNWAHAQNRIGYIAMAQGKFEEAEEAFRKYHFVAPDQANPHDSMGELLTLLGRYDEAQVAFEKALEIKPDFCKARFHLVDLFIMSGNFDKIEEVLVDAREHCEPEFLKMTECWAGFWKDFGADEYDAPFTEERSDCRKIVRRATPFILHRLAVASDQFDLASEYEREMRDYLETFESGAYEPEVDGHRGLLLHMEGTRLAAEGEVDAAQAKLLQADDFLLYWGNGQGILKLYNLLNLAELLRLTGDEQAADAILEKTGSVNAHFTDMVLSHGALQRTIAAP